jgi:tetratricopeptide (TPR) repeat protein
MPRLKFSILILSLLLALPSANAAGKTSTRASKESAAKRACLNGDPLRGVQLLTDLYILSENPTYIYNQGRCFEQNNRYEEAIGRFREYLRKVDKLSDADKADAKSAEKHIADCEALLGKKVADPANQPAPPPPPAPQPQPVIPVAPVVPAPAPIVVVSKPQAMPATSNGSGLRIAGVVTAAVGGAALVTGLILNLKVNGMIGDLEGDFNKGDYSSSKDYKTMSQVSYGVGAACLVSGTILYFLGVRAGSQVAISPSVGQGMAGAFLTGGF